MRRRIRLIPYTAAILVLGFTLTVGALSLIRAIGTIGDPFSGFFYGPNLLVGIGQRSEWPGIRAGLRSLDRIVAVDGAAVPSGSDLADLVARSRPGEIRTYGIDRKGEAREISVPVSRIGLDDFLVVFLIPFLMGLLFVAFGGILYFRQPSARGSLVYLILCCFIGLFCMAVYEAYTTFAFFRLILLYPLIGALLVHLLSFSPETPSRKWRIRLLLAVIYLAALVLVAFRQIHFLHAGESSLLSKLSSFYVLLVLSTSLLLIVRAFIRAKTQAARDKIKVIGIGLFLAGSVVAAWSLNFLLVARSFYLDEGILLAAVFPLFMSYAVLRKNVFELDRVIRLSLSYGIAAAVVLVLYLGTVAAVREFVSPKAAFGRHFGLLFALLAGLGALLFNRLRRFVNDLVRRILFRSRFDLSQALADLDRSLVAGSSASQIAERVAERLCTLLRLERAAVLCPSTHVAGRAIARAAQWEDSPALERWLPRFEEEGLLEELRKNGRSVEVSRLPAERFRVSAEILCSHGIEALVPCVSSGKLFGILLLGAKASRERWEGDELGLLQPIAARMGIVLENAELTVAADRQARLAALGQMASVLIHDIKNPLSTIKISAGSIKKRFREGDHARELATFVEEEVDRMDRTIQGILTYAKPAGLSLREFSVNGLVRKIAERVRPLSDRSGVRLLVEEGTEDIPFRGDETLVGRALENLIVNAVEATAAGGVVTARVSSDGAARLVLTVEDTGKGMDASIREEVFKPFFTTKDHGTGLGLAIVRQVVTEHGGEVELESRPGRGTRVTLAFPLVPGENR